jgi:carbamoyl-phosphate synthase large subunit
VVDVIFNRQVECVINVPQRSADEKALTDGYRIRRTAADVGVPLVNDAELARLFIRALLTVPADTLPVRPLSAYTGRAPARPRSSPTTARQSWA